jgi:hypothetical protein
MNGSLQWYLDDPPWATGPYRLFVERGYWLLTASGRVGWVLPLDSMPTRVPLVSGAYTSTKWDFIAATLRKPP